MKLVITFLFVLISFPIISQDCKCEEELKFVINYYEENLPGFSDNVNDKNREAYTNFKNNLLLEAKKQCSNENNCFKTLLTYVEFFKDNHSSIRQNRNIAINETNKEEVSKFINSSLFKERELLKSVQTKNTTVFNEIENTYQSDDETYTVAIIKSPNNLRDYAAVIVESKTPLWIKGQIKFELKQVAENTYDMFIYMRNHSIQYFKNIKLVNGILNDSWYNINLKKRKSYNILTSKELTFKVLDNETNYLYIPTFSANWFAKLSEFYAKNDSLIQSKPYLIIDVRNNGGGSDACVSPLLNYIYTKPFNGDNVDLYCTKENIRKSIEWFDANKSDTINFDKQFLKEITDEIELMKAAPDKTFIARSKGEQIKLDKVLANPKKVAILTNKYCASSCESLLFWALESDKTIIVGENSGGYVGYGEISEVKTPHFNFELGCTMTRYTKQRAFEVIGISPNFYLNNESDWIEQTIKILKK